MKISNLDLWRDVEKTDPEYTKKAKKGAYHFTSIAPIYQFKQATRVFGVQGIGWGVVVGSEKFTEQAYDTTTILSYDAALFFVYDEKRGEIPIHASEKSCYKTQGANGYMKIDDEVRKKVVTNAKTKGLSELGFNADIFMGQFDDPNYLAMIENEFALEKATDKIEEQEKQDAEWSEWVDSSEKLILSCVSLNELKGVYTSVAKKARLYADKVAEKRFEAAKEKTKLKLEINEGKS